MIRHKKIFISLILLGCILLFLFHLYAYLNMYISARSFAYNLGEELDATPEIACTIIPYEMLSNKYQLEISEDEYNNADEPIELLELYLKPIFKKYSNRSVDISLSTDGYKKEPAGYFKVENQWYYMRHEIDIRPDFITLNLKVVRWYIEISEVETPKGVHP